MTDSARKPPLPGEATIDEIESHVSVVVQDEEDLKQDDPVIVRIEKPEELLEYIRVDDVESLSETIFTLCGDGVKKCYSGFHLDLALEPLIFLNPEHVSNMDDPNYWKPRQLNKLLADQSSPYIGDDKFMEATERAFTSSRFFGCIEFDKGKLTTPYGSYGIFGFSPSLDPSPLIFSYISSIYSMNSSCRARVYENMSDFAKEMEKDRGVGKMKGHDITYAVFGLVPDSGIGDISKGDMRNVLKILESIFFRLYLPLLMADKNIIGATGCTILDNGLMVMNRDKIKAIYINFLSKIKLIQKIADFSSFSIRDARQIILNDNIVNENSKIKIYDEIRHHERTEDFYPTHREEDKESIKLKGRVCRAVDIQNLDDLAKMYPNFQVVVDYLKPYVRHSYLKSQPLYFPPLLVAGPPGIGKSSVMAAVYQALGFPVEILQASQFTSGWALVGMQNGWASAHQGIVAKTMQSQEVYNPIICLDELDKISNERKYVSVESALLRLLEPIEAVNFRDANFDAPHDVSGVNWIFTCNYPKQISGPLLSRLKIVYVYPPITREAIDTVHRNMWKELIKKYKAGDEISEILSADILVHLEEQYYDKLHFRGSKIALDAAIKSVISSAVPGVRVALTLHTLLDREKSTSIKPIVLH